MAVIIHRSPLLTLILVVAAAAWTAMLHGGVRGQAPAPAPGPSGLDCTNYYFNLTDCLSYVEAGSKEKAPAKACCPEVAGLLDSHPICLCELLAGGAESFGITVDNNRALNLASVCHLQAPPVSMCSAMGIPVSSPMPPSPSPSAGSIEHSPGSSPPKAPESAPPPATSNLAAPFGAVDLAAAAGFIVVGVIAIF